ncbi:MAG: hypothetical protein L0Y71_24730 [Gemmataceae bacterium]|nr:hypothetical protein [Gemmataceae bacterium]
MELCCHCGHRRATRPRQLCWRCYGTRRVRMLYALTKPRGRRRARPATHPTDALPGSLEKILVLMRRAELRQDLWHPDDAPFGGRPPLEQAG